MVKNAHVNRDKTLRTSVPGVRLCPEIDRGGREPDRPSFQRLVRDIVAPGQRQHIIRDDETPHFMALVLLGIFGQAMLTALSSGSYCEHDVIRVVRIVVEGIGNRNHGR